MDELIKCPKCGSTQITANKKGFSTGQAAAGVLLTGGIGLLAGGIGSNKILLTCMACGNQWKPGEDKPAPPRIASAGEKKGARVLAIITAIVCALFMLMFAMIAINVNMQAAWGVAGFGLATWFFVTIARKSKGPRAIQ